MIDRRAVIWGGAALGWSVSGGRAGAASLPAKVRAIDTLALPPGFAGVLAFGREGRVAHVRRVGLADVEAQQPVLPQTRFRWGSGTKWLVSVAALRLQEQGRIDLEAPIATYLPDVRGDTGARVRLRHLLSNTSGIPDLLGRQVKAEPGLRTSTATPRAIVARFAGGDLAFAPGEGWDYAALNWAIVAAVLTQVSGEDLPTLVARLVLRPLGLTDTGFAQADQPPMPTLAAAYTAATPPARAMPPVPPFLAGSGTVAGTVEDAIRAAHGIVHGRLLRPRSVAALTTVHWPAEDYALGGRVHRIDGEPWAWETGKTGGYRAHIAHRLGRSETVAIFNTTDLAQSTLAGWAETIARA